MLLVGLSWEWGNARPLRDQEFRKVGLDTGDWPQVSRPKLYPSLLFSLSPPLEDPPVPPVPSLEPLPPELPWPEPDSVELLSLEPVPPVPPEPVDEELGAGGGVRPFRSLVSLSPLLPFPLSPFPVLFRSFSAIACDREVPRCADRRIGG